jgi:hypothetical protein
MDFDIFLGAVLNDAHAAKLAEVAAWLDANKFSCTFSVYEGAGHFTITPNPDSPHLTWELFLSYARDTVICALSAHLNPEVTHAFSV